MLASSSDIPDRPFNGVRNSWLMLARNRLLAWFARRASSIAWVSAFSSEAKYSGTATRPSSRPQDRYGFCSQYGVVRIMTANDSAASAVALNR